MLFHHDQGRERQSLHDSLNPDDWLLAEVNGLEAYPVTDGFRGE